MHGVLPVQTDTVVSPPVGVYDQTEGHIRVSVLNAASQPVSGSIVTIDEPHRGRLRHRDHGRRRVRVLRLQADRRVHGDALVRCREGRRSGKRDARAERDREVRLDEHRAVRVRHGGHALAHAVARSRPDTPSRRGARLASATRRSSRTVCCRTRGLREPSLDPEPVPVLVRIPGVGRELLRRRPARGEPARRPVLLGRRAGPRDRHDAGRNELRNDRPSVDEPAVQA